MAALKKRWQSFYRKHPYLSNLTVAVVAFAFLLILVAFFLSWFTRHGQSQVVPDFTGLTFEEAEQLAGQQNLRLVISDSVFVNSRPRGTVFRQLPAINATVKKDRRIFLTVNALQQRMVEMPDVVGYSLRQAKTVLLSAGLHVGHLNYVNDLATNNVLGQRHKGAVIRPGAQLPAESEIDLEVGKSALAENTAVPLLIGYTAVEARDVLAESSLNIGTLRYDETVGNYLDSLLARVYKQSPGSSNNSLPLGYRVDVWLTVDGAKIAE